MQSYKTFHNDPYSIAKNRFDKKLSPAFLSYQSANFTVSIFPGTKVRRAVPSLSISTSIYRAQIMILPSTASTPHWQKLS
ncbi:hypothetical protein [uncultured Phocaeicola sp.]|uniref:hypothetical protein n=1 Tax=uncultured Phocaeicola sp. TaxID=990718 RepID=UPI00155A02DC|nr:hypothetical protein [uncultured Phocaeicola sp.]